MDKVIFLDRDGTLNEEINYLHRPEDLRIFPDVPEALRELKEHGFKLVVVTNQAGVARGYYTEEDVNRLHEYMNTVLRDQDAGIDAYFYCPHHPEHGIGKYKMECDCRKPGTGMFKRAEELFDVDKDSSWMIGDNKCDLLAGRNYGVRTALVGTGYGAGTRNDPSMEGMFDIYADTLLEIANIICDEDAGHEETVSEETGSYENLSGRR